jgi:hypothetical protein
MTYSITSSFQYEWWTVKMKLPTGVYTCECKAKNKKNAIKRFKKFDNVIEIYWDTLTLDRKGYQRRF